MDIPVGAYAGGKAAYVFDPDGVEIELIERKQGRADGRMSAPPELLIQQAPRKKLAETVAQQILEAVRDLPAGTRLPPERELTKRMGVGRSTVREALNGLAMMGVVEIRHGQGVFVAEPPADRAGDLERSLPPKAITDELLEARRIVEVELARLAAERRTEDDLAAMQTLLDTHRADLEAGRGPDHAGVSVPPPGRRCGEEPDPGRRGAAVLPTDARARPAALYETTEGYAQWELDQHQRDLRCDPLR